MRRGDYLYEHPARLPGRKSVVREAPNPLKGANVRPGGAQANENGSSFLDALKKHKVIVLSGVALLVVGLAYHLYSKRSSQGKDDQTTATGVEQIAGAQAAAGKPTLQMDPVVLQQLQQQVEQYRDHIGALQDAVMKRDQQIEQMRAMGQGLGPESGFTTMAAQLGVGAQAGALGQFSGLHGQMPPYVSNFRP